VLPAIHVVEGGTVDTVSQNRDGSQDLGLMQINTRWLPVLARHTRHDEVTVRQALRRCCKTRASISPWRERSCGWI
jgi:hypothetical protein